MTTRGQLNETVLKFMSPLVSPGRKKWADSWLRVGNATISQRLQIQQVECSWCR